MKFKQIEMLFLIWTIPVFLLVMVYGMKKRRRILSRFSTARALGAIAPEMHPKRRWIKAGLVLTALLFLSLALAGPQYGYKWEKIEERGVDLIIALDLSRSMLASDIQPTRLDRAKREIYDLLGMLKGDRVGLVAFAGTAFLQCPLTQDYDAFNIFLNSLTPDSMPVGGTDIAGAVHTALSAFDMKTASQKAVILITDGENTGSGDPMAAAEQAKKDGVKLFCIGVGSQEGVPVPAENGGIRKDRTGNIVMTRIDEALLKKMALMTDGTYVRSVAGSMDLDVIYTKEIRGKMEAATLSTHRKQIWEDRFQWALALAVLALLAELMMPAARKKAAGLSLVLLLLWAVPAHAGNPLKEGVDAYRQGSYEKALKLFIDAQLDHPDRPDILYNIGNAYYQLGKFDEAAKNYQEALKAENKDLQEKSHYNLGNAEFRRQQYEEAVKNYEAALKLNPHDEQARQNLDFTRKVMKEQKKQQEQQQQSKGDRQQNPDDQKNNKDQKDQNSDSENKKDHKDAANSEPQPDTPEEKKNPSSAKQEPQPGQDPKNENDNSASPQFGKEMPGPKTPQSDATQQPAGQDEKGKNAEPQNMQPPPPSNPSGQGENPEDRKQADQILNRLKDQPGKAMIPSYGKTEVEKDW